MCMAQTPQPLAAARAAHVAVGGQGGDVVDDLRPGGKALGGNLRAGRVDRNRHVRLLPQGDDHRQHAAEFFLGRDRRGPGPRALAADIQHVGALGRQPQAVLDGRRRLEEPPAVGEAVGRHVHHAHQQRDAAGSERLGPQSPGKREIAIGFHHGFSISETICSARRWMARWWLVAIDWPTSGTTLLAALMSTAALGTGTGGISRTGAAASIDPTDLHLQVHFHLAGIALEGLEEQVLRLAGDLARRGPCRPTARKRPCSGDRRSISLTTASVNSSPSSRRKLLESKTGT